jgi:hypothetical protein
MPPERHLNNSSQSFRGRAAESQPPTPAELAGPGLRAFLKIADAWQLSPVQQAELLGVGRSTFYELRRKAEARQPVNGASRDMIERLSYVLGIYESLHTMFANNRAFADEWVNRPNTDPFFSGKRALDRMLAGRTADLYTVYQYLQSRLH